MLIGKFEHSLDAKRRLPMPARLRDALGKTVVITRGFEQCLGVYPLEAWKEFADKLQKLPVSQVSARALKRTMLSGAVEAELDAFGRVLIPDYLADHAGLKKMS